MRSSIHKKIIQSPRKFLSVYGSSFQSHSSLCSFNSEPYPSQNFRSDFNSCYETPSYIWSLTLLSVGCLIQAFGVVLEMKPNVVAMSGEGFVKYASRRFGKDFGRVKVMTDVGLVLLAVVTSLVMAHKIIGVREGTVVAALGVGLLVSLINTRLINRISVHKIVERIKY